MIAKMGEKKATQNRGGRGSKSAAFPKNVEPRGKTRFGPAPRKPKPTTKNVFNTDSTGKAKPWKGDKR